MSRRPLLAGGAALAAAAVGGWFAWDRYTAPARQPSIAVLPFANLSGDPARQYFADGMAEELRNALARIDRLKVIGRTSSESVRNAEARNAARQLGVRHVLLGSVRQSPATIRISAQLIDGSSGVELWSETYDRPPGDVLAIQSGIARSVAEALVIRLAPSEEAALAAGGTTNVAAYDLMLKALALDAQSDDEEGQREALGYMDAALALDPNYADAHATRSLRLIQVATYYAPSTDAMHAMGRTAVAAARRGVKLAPNSAASRSALGWALQFQLRFQEAQRELEQAYRVGRGDARTLRIYATFLWKIGKVREAMRIADESRALDPLHPRHQLLVAQALLAAGRYAEAAQAARKVLKLAPNRISARACLITILLLQGRDRDGLAELAKLPAGSLQRLRAEAIVFHRLRDAARSDAAFADAKEHFGERAIYELATVEAQRNRRSEALLLLEKASKQRDPDLSNVAGDRLLDPLRDAPRFKAIVGQLQIPA